MHLPGVDPGSARAGLTSVKPRPRDRRYGAGSGPDLRARLRALEDEENRLDPQALAEFGASHGYEFSAEDVEFELDDRELEAVVGGVLTGTAASVELPFDQDIAWKKKPAKK